MDETTRQRLESFLETKGLRKTIQRQAIIEAAFGTEKHFTAEELVRDVRIIDPSVARGTIYRTLALLHGAGIVEKHDFRYGAPNYEVTFGKAHHDHLMCVQCGEIIEFQEPRVERIQQEVVKRFDYQLLSHTHKLYGLCRACRQLDPKRVSKPPQLHVEEIVA